MPGLNNLNLGMEQKAQCQGQVTVLGARDQARSSLRPKDRDRDKELLLSQTSLQLGPTCDGDPPGKSLDEIGKRSGGRKKREAAAGLSEIKSPESKGKH